MLKKFTRLSTIVLASAIVVSVAYADDYMPPDKFKDPVKQFTYVQQSVRDSETPWAEYKLGLYYENGYGVKKDIVKAYAWYHCAAIDKSTLGIKAFNTLKASMTKEQIAEGDKEYRKIVGEMLSQNTKDVNNTGF